MLWAVHFTVSKKRATTAQAVAEIGGQRASFDIEIEFRPARSSERELVSGLERASRSRELSELGFRPLGDLAMAARGRAVVAVMRVFTDPTQTILALVTDDNSVRGPGLSFASFTEGTEWSTLVLGHSYIETGPALRIQDLPWMTKTHSALAGHRELVASADTLVSIASVLEVADRMHAAHVAVGAWRRAQDPDELLDRDLRVFLEDEYLRRPAFWKRRIVSRVPPARVVQRET